MLIFPHIQCRSLKVQIDSVNKPVTEASEEITRTRLLQIARDCVMQSSLEKFRMSDLYTAANVSRRTLYNYFSSKEEILMGVVELESDEFLLQLRSEMAPQDTFADYLIESLVYIICNQHKQTLSKELFASRSRLIGDLYRSSMRIHKNWYHMLEPSFLNAQTKLEINPQLSLDRLIQWYGRLVLSYTQFPPEINDVTALREELRQFIILGVQARD